jgi:GNAT superfamily N-acetyltransferase
MSQSVAGQTRLKRLRAIHRRMSFATFERIPRRPGWKHEYYGGMAHIRPATVMVTFRLDLDRGKAVRRPGLRAVDPADAAALEAPFLAAFAAAPEYANYDARRFRKAAAEYFCRFFGDERAVWFPGSVVASIGGTPVGAALVKLGESGPLLDCLFVHPNYERRGLATAMVARLVQALRRGDARQMLSHAMLANEASLQWHHRFGFVEVPDLRVASYRRLCYEHEVERHRSLNDIPEAELAELTKAAAQCRAEVRRLEEMEEKDFWSAHPRFG